MKEKNSSEEIDLLPIFSNIKKSFFMFFQRLGELKSFSIKNIKILSIFIIIGVGISLAVFSLKKTVYISHLSMSHKRLNNGQCIDLMNSLSKLVGKDTLLANKLGIDIKLAKQIKSISYLPLNKIKESDSLLNFSDFKIEVKVYNTTILDSLQKGILNFLESNEYATKRKEINKLYFDKFEEKIKTEIISIDSLKRIVDKSILPRSLGNGIILGESIDPVKVYQEGMNLYKSQLNINEQRELNNSFEVIIGFSPAIPSSSLVLNIFVGIISSLVLGLLWLYSRTSKNSKE